MQSFVGTAAVLYTTDGNNVGFLRCGKIPNVYATIDFGKGEYLVLSQCIP